MFSALAVLLAGSLQAFAADHDDVARTWTMAEVSLYARGYQVHGLMGGALTQQRLDGLPADVKFPTIIFLHDCKGPDGPQGPFFEYLNENGFAVIAPNSFARRDRPRLCSSANQWFDGARMAEIGFALARLKQLRWVDQGNLFLVGQGEGGEYAARYDGTEFRGRVAPGAVCDRGQGRSTPLFVIVSQNDSMLEDTPTKCEGADSFMEVEGSAHWVWVYPASRMALLDFLLEHMVWGG